MVQSRTEDFLYQQVADRLERLIHQGLFNAGDKLPSVRTLSKEQGISLSTAFQAYVQLEAKGLIEARPKSGYYVRNTLRKAPFTPTTRRTTYIDPKQLSVDDMIRVVYENLSDDSVIRLSIAAPSLELLPEAKLNKAMAEAIRTSRYSCLNYEHVQGNALLRNQIARLSFNWGGSITADDIVTTQGCMEALMLCLKATTLPGDTVAIESPTYFGIFGVMQSLGLKAIEIPTDPVNGPDIDFLEMALQQVKVSACLFVPTFNNPTGACMPEANKQRLVEMLTKKGIPLIEDDIYGELYFGNSRPRTCKSYDKAGIVLYCTSVSKSLAPGYRVGWIIPGRYKEQILRQKMRHTITSATPTQAAIGLFFEKGRYELHLRHLRRALCTQSYRDIQAISNYFPEGIKISNPMGGYVLWVELDKRINAFDLYQRAIQHHISIAPGNIFSVSPNYNNYIRLSFGHPLSKDIEKGLETLGALIRELME